MRSEFSLAVGVAVVHALGGWGYPAALVLIRGEPERARNTRGTGSGFIYLYIIIMYVCGVIISVRRELNFERVR